MSLHLSLFACGVETLYLEPRSWTTYFIRIALLSVGALDFRQAPTVHQQDTQRYPETEAGPPDTAPLSVHPVEHAIGDEEDEEKRHYTRDESPNP
jgi:hypothetical protein